MGIRSIRSDGRGSRCVTAFSKEKKKKQGKKEGRKGSHIPLGAATQKLRPLQEEEEEEAIREDVGAFAAGVDIGWN